MKKYDCTKALDLIHEYRRLCDSHPAGCDNDCPLCGMDYCNLYSFDEDKIALLQKWSDEHPEAPKLTKKEREFIEGFRDNSRMTIKRISQNSLGVCQYTPYDRDIIMLDPSMFSFIPISEEWDFQKLLGLEVSDD